MHHLLRRDRLYTPGEAHSDKKVANSDAKFDENLQITFYKLKLKMKNEKSRATAN